MGRKPKKPSVGSQVNELVAALDVEAASDADVQAAAERVCAMGREAVESLARGILRPGPGRRETVTALLGCLSGEPAAWAAGQLEALLGGARRLGAMERVWLTATAQRLRETALPPGEGPQPPPSRVGAQAEPIDASELLMWRDELAELPAQQRPMALAPILDSGDPSFLPVLEVAVSLGDAGLDAAVAGGLGRFATSDALPLLRELLRSPSQDVRLQARQSLLALGRQGVAVTEVFVAAPEAADAESRAYASEPDAAGRMLVEIAGRRGERWHHVGVYLDAVEAGIRDAWGEEGLSEAELRAQIEWAADDFGVEVAPMDVDVARALVAAAESYARQEGEELPAEYVVWRRWIGRAGRLVALPMVFGPRCTECGSRLTGDDIDRGGLVAGDAALCGDCAEEPRPCVGCGRPLHATFDELVVRRAAGGVEFTCLACERKARRGRR